MNNPPATWGTWVPGWADSLEEGMATPSSILAGEPPWTVEPGGLQLMGSQRAGQSRVTTRSTAEHGLCACSVLSSLATPWAVAPPRLLCQGDFFREECWSGLPFPPSVYLPDQGVKPAPPVSPACQVGSLPLSPMGSPEYRLRLLKPNAIRRC